MSSFFTLIGVSLSIFAAFPCLAGPPRHRESPKVTARFERRYRDQWMELAVTLASARRAGYSCAIEALPPKIIEAFLQAAPTQALRISARKTLPVFDQVLGSNFSYRLLNADDGRKDFASVFSAALVGSEFWLNRGGPPHGSYQSIRFSADGVLIIRDLGLGSAKEQWKESTGSYRIHPSNAENAWPRIEAKLDNGDQPLLLEVDSAGPMKDLIVVGSEDGLRYNTHPDDCEP